jgi:hypothetical protein
LGRGFDLLHVTDAIEEIPINAWFCANWLRAIHGEFMNPGQQFAVLESRELDSWPLSIRLR